MLVKTPLTQSTKAINNVNVIQNIYSKKLNNERPTNGTSWYSFVTNTGFEAFYYSGTGETRKRAGGGRHRYGRREVLTPLSPPTSYVPEISTKTLY